MMYTETELPDGLYQVTTSYLCAGFVVNNHQVTECAPILRNKLQYWLTVARPVLSSGINYIPP